MKSGGAPVLIRDIARVELVSRRAPRHGRPERRGRSGPSGIAVARYGENALSVIQTWKQKLAEIARGLPRASAIHAVYDRSDLIHAPSTHVALHADRGKPDRRAGLRVVPVPRAQALVDPDAAGRRADRLHRDAQLGMNSNIMSLGGIAIAIGAMVDAAIVMIENAHKHIERATASPTAAACS